MNESAVRILLVEDDAITRFAEQLGLERAGYAVAIARSGEEAVASVSVDQSIDLVLMDIDLGTGIDGFEATRQLVQKRQIPVVFLTSYEDSAHVSMAATISDYGYLAKNTSIAIIDAGIKMALRLAAARG